MIAGAVHEQQDELPTVLLSQLANVSRKIWKHRVSGAGRIKKTQVPSFGLTALYNRHIHG
jgi:hypothetical protein